MTSDTKHKKNNVHITTLISIAIMFLLGSTIIFFKILNHSELDHVSGAWLVLANDLSNGLFYRPLYSQTGGIGGTRFFPLFFSLNSFASVFGFNAVTWGHFISVLLGLLFLWITYSHLNKLSQTKVLCIFLMGFLLLTNTVINGFSAIKSDIFPVFFNLTGIYLFFRYKGSNSSAVHIPVLFFLIAFASKVTSLNGIATIFIWYTINKNYKDAFKTATIFSIGAIAYLFLLYVWSDGRIWEIFQTCASGNPPLEYAVKAPIHFLKNISNGNIVAFFLFISALICIEFKAKTSIQTIYNIYFVLALVQIILLFASPGIDSNHFIDLVSASVLLIAARIGNLPSRNSIHPIAVISVVALFSLLRLPALKTEYEKLTNGQPNQISALANYLAPYDSILSEDPLVPVIAGKTTVLQDAFMYKYVIAKYPEAEVALLDKLKKRDFEVVVLKHDPLNPIWFEWYNSVHLNKKFFDVLLENYFFEMEISDQRIYKPLPRPN